MVSASDFVANSSIRWGRLATVLFGASIFAYFEGFVAAFLSLVDIPLSLLAGYADFLGRAVSIAYGLPSIIIEQGFAAAVPFVLDAGFAGYLVALVIVLVTLFPIAWVVSRVG
ncbi:hypothetical protein [Haloarcula pellucida]|uniref:Uncharacterized protein n=1 Tax=Haloarcula pellucida TaxID=1427151 RepID=A0A830GLT9_9EURY|nr:hypothetical protein [Halomicroarcula pellucida]MBX0348675.1 hypothetical protein [Halomicroarcula pellucida]GGN92271.1 hypothetical protein GCM10009030_16340 [Halomicroarcula pellucida]